MPVIGRTKFRGVLYGEGLADGVRISVYRKPGYPPVEVTITTAELRVLLALAEGESPDPATPMKESELV